MQREFDKVRLGVAMDSRTERWLEETDEFGFIMISIGMSCRYSACNQLISICTVELTTVNATDRFANLAVEPLV